MQEFGDGKWSLVMQLDARSGYLQHEVNEYCNARNYMPRTEVGVQVYMDEQQCCRDTKDFDMCVQYGCQLTEVTHAWVHQPLSFKMTITGNVFAIELHHYLLEGTEFTSPTRANKVRQPTSTCPDLSRLSAPQILLSSLQGGVTKHQRRLRNLSAPGPQRHACSHFDSKLTRSVDRQLGVTSLRLRQ